jgi:tryptophanyl-tRNA synthetase
VPAHAQLAYLLECTAVYGEMTRMIQFKEKAGAERSSARLSLLTYPALMAADILLYRADTVPVGEDQRQHLELTRTLARRFNARYRPVFTVPSAVVPPAAARVRSLRDPSVKMGKSGVASGVVLLLDDPVRIAAAVRSAVTDLDPALGYDPELRPGVANLAELLGALTDRTPQAALVGLRGAGALKAALTEALVETLRPVRSRYAELTADPAELDRRLAAGAAAADELAAPTLADAREAMGLPRR